MQMPTTQPRPQARGCSARRRALSSAAAALLLAAGCSRTSERPPPASRDAPATLRVAVVNAPLALFVERIAGTHATVVFPCPADEDPAFWSPDDNALAQYAEADLILLNGAGYAKWVPTASLPTSRMVSTLAGADERLVADDAAVTHSHGPAGEHTHAGTAFTTWLDFDLARAQATAVRDALTAKRPDLAPEFETRWGELDADLAALDLRLQAVGKSLAGRPIIASHPVYQYLARRAGLTMRSVHWEPGEIPSREAQEDFVVMLRDFPATLMLWEGDPAPTVAEWLGTLGIRCVVVEPGGNRPPGGDLLETWRTAIARLEAAAVPGS